MRELALPNRHTLTPKGEAWVGTNQDSDVYRTRVRGDSESADHMVATADVWVAITRRLSGRGRVNELRFTTEAEVRRRLSVVKGALIPDGIVTLGGGVTLAIEVDLGSERADIIVAKFRKYAPHLMRRTPLQGVTLDAVLILAPTLRRLAWLALAAREAGIEGRCLFQRLGDVSERTVLDRLATFDAIARAAESTSTPNPFTHSLLENPT